MFADVFVRVCDWLLLVDLVLGLWEVCRLICLLMVLTCGLELSYLGGCFQLTEFSGLWGFGFVGIWFTVCV